MNMNILNAQIYFNPILEGIIFGALFKILVAFIGLAQVTSFSNYTQFYLEGCELCSQNVVKCFRLFGPHVYGAQ